MVESIEVINEVYNTISKELLSYLRETFYRNNHTKYRKYFDECVNNLMPSQIFYFEKQRLNIIDNANIQH